MIKGTGAKESHYDSRTITHNTTTALPLIKGGIQYLPTDIDDQYGVGICTGISLTQNAGKALAKKFSPDFQYLCQKKFYDLYWDEGSSIFNALKVGKDIGFLPIELFPYITVQDRLLPYDQYIKKLQNIPDTEVQRLISLCTDKLAGYAQVPIDAQSIAKAIVDSKSGVLCRYTVGPEWYTAPNGQISWNPKDIDPIQPPKSIVGGHAIGASNFDFTLVQNITHPNTWGTDWDLQGNCNIVHDKYPCTEAWIPYYDTVPTPAPAKYVFTQDMKLGDTSEDVRQLQLRLISLGYAIQAGATGYYGPQTRQAVFQYQLANVTLSLYERYVLAGKVCGSKTRATLNR